MKIIVGEKPDYKLPNTDLIDDFYYHPEEPGDWIHTLNPGRLLPKDCKMPVDLNDDILNHVISEVAKIKTDKIISISQADGFDFNGDSESLIRFVNNVAIRFPDKKFSTLAYIKTQKPPKTRPLPNVEVIITTILVPKDKPIELGNRGEAIEFRDDIQGWLKLTKNIVVWDYYSNFRHLLMPFPCIYPMIENFKFYQRLGIKKFIVQTNAGLGHEFWELKSLLLSYLMDGKIPNLNNCLKELYGNAWIWIKMYIDGTHKRANKYMLNWFDADEHRNSFLNSPVFDMYIALAKSCRLSKEERRRVEEVELQLIYAKMELGIKCDWTKLVGWDITVNEFNLKASDYLKQKL